MTASQCYLGFKDRLGDGVREDDRDRDDWRLPQIGLAADTAATVPTVDVVWFGCAAVTCTWFLV